MLLWLSVAAASAAAALHDPVFAPWDVEEPLSHLSGLSADVFPGWRVSAGSTLFDPLAGRDGTGALVLGPSSEATVSLVSSAEQVWVDLQLRAAGSWSDGESPPPAPGAVTLWIGAGGQLRALNGDGQGSGEIVALPVEVAPDRWLRLTLFVDFAVQRWDLFADGEGLRADLGFGIPTIGLHAFALGTAGTAALWADDVVIRVEAPSDVGHRTGDVNGDGLVDVADLVRITNHLNGNLITDPVRLDNGDLAPPVGLDAADAAALAGVLLGEW